LYAVAAGRNRRNGSGNVRGCGEWNTCYEEKIAKPAGAGHRAAHGQSRCKTHKIK